eukprot:5471169-Alexandrium_andersonii.AAC.1
MCHCARACALWHIRPVGALVLHGSTCTRAHPKLPRPISASLVQGLVESNVRRHGVMNWLSGRSALATVLAIKQVQLRLSVFGYHGTWWHNYCCTGVVGQRVARA